MEKNGQSQFLCSFVDSEGLRTDRVKVLVVWAEFDTTQPQITCSPLDFVHHIGLPGMDAQKTDELIRVSPHERGGVVVDLSGRILQSTVVGHISGWIRSDIEADRFVDTRHRLNVIVPGVHGRSFLIRSPLGVELPLDRGWLGAVARCMGMNIDNHLQCAPSVSISAISASSARAEERSDNVRTGRKRGPFC